jgi:hypothetical protein
MCWKCWNFVFSDTGWFYLPHWAIKLHLKRDLYHVPDDNRLHVESDDEVSTNMADSDNESGLEDSNDETR